VCAPMNAPCSSWRLRPLAAVLGPVTMLVLGGVIVLSGGPTAHIQNSAPAILPPDSTVSSPSALGPVPDEFVSTVSPGAMLGAAVSSLNHGAGPAFGTPSDCAVSSPGAAVCGEADARPHPNIAGTMPISTSRSASLAAAPQWYNAEPNISAASKGDVPSVQFSGRMAYDPLLSEIVLFDGCDFSASPCPRNTTWTYNGISWTDLTPHLSIAPSPREGAGLDYDPAFGGVVLFGGQNNVTGNLGDTWLFNSSGWYNLTSVVGYPQKTGGGDATWSYGAMAYDPDLKEMVVVDGCENAQCSAVWSDTWHLTVDKWTVSAGPGASTATALAYTSAAYDPVDQDLVLFGGYDPGTGTSSNDTFLLDPSGVWTNVTLDDAGCVSGTCYAPPARDSEAMTWDSQLDAIFMTDGYNVTTSTWLNDSWLFAGGLWLPADLRSPTPPSSFCPAAQPAMPEESSNVAPILVGGSGPCEEEPPVNFSSEWVFEVPPQPSLTASHHQLDVGNPANFTISWTVGTGSGVVATWNVSLGNGQYHAPARAPTKANTSSAFSENFSYAYPSPGTFVANVTWTDFFYISGTGSALSETINPDLSVTLDASATSVTAGGSVTFSARPVGGTAPLEYAWSFGDGTASTAPAPPAHTYSSAGSYTVNLTVTDAVGNSANRSVTIVVGTGPAKGPLGLGTTDLYLIGAILFVLVAVVIALVVMRRQKPPRSAPVPYRLPPRRPTGSQSPPVPPGALRRAPGEPPEPPPPRLQ
jgi:hypothetical protein